jgi:uncharacterized protein (DUF885 family)
LTPAAPAGREASARAATPVDLLADDYLERAARLDPCDAARMAIGGPSDELTDYSREGGEARAELNRTIRRQLSAIDDGSVTAGMLREWLDARLAASDAGDDQYALRIIFGPVETIRGSFDNMARVTPDDWALVVSRLERVPAAVYSVRSGVERARADGRVEPRRQALAVASQCETFAGPAGGAGWFATLADECRRFIGRGPLPDAAERAAFDAAGAYRELGAWLRTDYAPVAAEADGVGPERYARAARIALGADLDPAEAYAWGWDELHRLARRSPGWARPSSPGRRSSPSKPPSTSRPRWKAPRPGGRGCRS